MRSRFRKLMWVTVCTSILLVVGVAVVDSAVHFNHDEMLLAADPSLDIPVEVISEVGGINEVTTSDFDNDGHPDIAYVNNTALRIAQNFIGMGGTWTTTHSIGSTAQNISAFSSADMNRDARIDLVTLSGASVRLWGNPASAFVDAWITGASLTVTAGISQTVLVVEDLNLDGAPDIITGDGNGVIRLRRNPMLLQGDITTQWGILNELTTLTGKIIALQVEDLDRDGKSDLIIISGDTSPKLTIMRNPGSPFSSAWNQTVDFLPTVVLTVANASQLSVADMDGDNWPDIIVGGSNGGMQGWSNPGSAQFAGTWSDPLIFDSVSGNLTNLVPVDLNNDANLELVGLVDSTVMRFYVWELDEASANGSGPLVWNASLARSYNGSLVSVALADLDIDGDEDLIAGGLGGVNTWQNQLPPWAVGFNPGVTAGYDASWVLDLATADLDRDGAVDLVTNEMDGRIIARRNDGTPFDNTWITHEVGLMPDWWQCLSLEVGDIDNDGDDDLVTAYYHYHGPVVWENDGTPFTGTWSWQEIGVHRVGTVKLADMNGDGRLDIITGGGRAWNAEPTNEYVVAVWYAPASPFNDPWQLTTVGIAYYSVLDLDVGDIDNDGDLDIVIGTNHAPAVGDVENPVPRDQWPDVYQIRAFRNDGADIWTEFNVGRDPEIETLQFIPYHGFWGANVTGVSLVDLDNDGDLDIAATETLEGDFMVMGWQNDGTPFSGELWQPSAIAKGEEHNWILDSIWWLSPGDFDLDGDWDVVAGSEEGEPKQVMIWENSGIAFGDVISDTFWLRHNVGALGLETRAGGVADFDKDGDLDLVAAAFTEGASEIRMWENYNAPDIFLSINPDHQEVTIGQTTNFTVEVAGLYGFDQVVNLWVSGLPSGMEVAWSQDSLLPPGQSIMTLTAPLLSLPVEYQLLAVGIGENATGIAPFTVHVSLTDLYPLFLPLVLVE